MITVRSHSAHYPVYHKIKPTYYFWNIYRWWPDQILVLRGVSKKFGEWYQKTNKTEDTNKLTLLAFRVIAILHNTLLATFIKLLETVSKDLFRNRTQNRCHTFLDCCHVCKICAFHDAVQAGKQKEVRRRQIRGILWMIENRYA
jgi:hypothetical protein